MKNSGTLCGIEAHISRFPVCCSTIELTRHHFNSTGFPNFSLHNSLLLSNYVLIYIIIYYVISCYIMLYYIILFFMLYNIIFFHLFTTNTISFARLAVEQTWTQRKLKWCYSASMQMKIFVIYRNWLNPGINFRYCQGCLLWLLVVRFLDYSARENINSWVMKKYKNFILIRNFFVNISFLFFLKFLFFIIVLTD